ncbi:MAG: peptide chain release factor N(5)-glutamine methyltransferase [Selenomonadaceae bacterium]|nr:peptide chain release factor N(5)-glutamine methyltransferase [Selenomonadaceae bacterium]
MADEIWTIGRILKWTEQYFGGKGVESPRLDAEVLLSHVLGKERIYLYVHFDEPLEKGELAAYKDLIRQRVQRVPVAYLVGHREFMGLPFQVSRATLVPRPETELLVQAALERLKGFAGDSLLFADIGTGTGAICLSVLHFLPGSRAVTVDISPEAIAVARKNAEAMGLSERVEFLEGDLLAPLGERRFAAILSNPPYIPDGDISGLSPEVRDNEPMTALAGGLDGLDFYRRLCKDAPALLEQNGFLAFEVGIHQAAAVAGMAEENPLIARTEILKDLAGIARVVIAWRGDGAR